MALFLTFSVFFGMCFFMYFPVARFLTLWTHLVPPRCTFWRFCGPGGWKWRGFGHHFDHFLGQAGKVKIELALRRQLNFEGWRGSDFRQFHELFHTCLYRGRRNDIFADFCDFGVHFGVLVGSLLHQFCDKFADIFRTWFWMRFWSCCGLRGGPAGPRGKPSRVHRTRY